MPEYVRRECIDTWRVVERERCRAAIILSGY